jgi:CheY-like chemotaxis protein
MARLRILLVDDNRLVGGAMARLLRSSGHEVHLAASVSDALSYSDPCDVVVSDIALPDGTGYQLMRELRTRSPIPAVALSGWDTYEDDYADETFSHHLGKPVDCDVLIRALHDVVGTAPDDPTTPLGDWQSQQSSTHYHC